MIFIILPLPIVIAIYEYLHIKQLKKAYSQAHTLYKIEIARLDKKIVDKDKQIANYILLDNVRIDKIKKYEKEITELKKDKVKSILVKPHITGPSLIIPFNQDDNTTEELVLCVCGKEMRECKTMYVCDWCKKRRKKEVVRWKYLIKENGMKKRLSLAT